MTEWKTSQQKKQLCSSASVYILRGFIFSLGLSRPKIPMTYLVTKISQTSGIPGS